MEGSFLEYNRTNAGKDVGDMPHFIMNYLACR